MGNAIVLCSGGLDSVVTANYAKKKARCDKLKILFFNYGQRNLLGERKAAKKCAKDLYSEFIEINIQDISKFSKSFLHGNKKSFVKKKDLRNTEVESKKWYLPYRNLIFLSYALSIAETLSLKEKNNYSVFIGFKCEGKESYPDTTKEFLQDVNNIGKKSYKKIKVCVPLIDLDKEDIIALGIRMGVDLKNTFSCYVGSKKQCGSCLACRLRRAGFYWAGLEDPTTYESKD